MKPRSKKSSFRRSGTSYRKTQFRVSSHLQCRNFTFLDQFSAYQIEERDFMQIIRGEHYDMNRGDHDMDKAWELK
jgi:hypothetical protein